MTSVNVSLVWFAYFSYHVLWLPKTKNSFAISNYFFFTALYVNILTEFDDICTPKSTVEWISMQRDLDLDFSRLVMYKYMDLQNTVIVIISFLAAYWRKVEARGLKHLEIMGFCECLLIYNHCSLNNKIIELI